MHRFKIVTVLLIFVLTVFLPARAALASFTPSNGQPAHLVLGQPNFTSKTQGTSATAMFAPGGVAVDPTTGKVFVGDSMNYRILRFASLGALSNGAAAEAVLCQPDFVSQTSSLTACDPNGLSIDSAGRLWVADTTSNRVLRFDNASSKSNGAAPDRVLGQPDFSTGTPGATASKLNQPMGVFADSNGRLWVTDLSNNRVLRFDNAASKANGAAADGVLGQADFTSAGSGTKSIRMKLPFMAFLDSAGRLWVADGYNCRVLRFDNAAAKANGAAADGVLGQPDFTTGGPSLTQSTFSVVESVTVDNSTGTLYVSDSNNRVMVFNNAAGKANGANADYVLGQPDFTSNNPFNLSASGMYDPRHLFFDPKEKVLWVADRFNNRIIMFGQIARTFISTEAQDGWVLESGENTNLGATKDSAAATFRLGDNAAKKQYRGVLSFASGSALPDTAVITKVTLKVKKQAVTGEGDPVTAFQGFMVDIRKGVFGTSALQVSDFQAAANKSYGPFTPTLAAGWYSINLTSAKAYVNKLTTGGGLTQIRLRFQLDDDGNSAANFISIFSGNAGAASRPQLIVEYYVP
ncbi:MAG: NHL repeat-containing protein [Chloroflexi bacterium]|nr:NHL repeat-containing protein [Chloroflexota bacterium]